MLPTVAITKPAKTTRFQKGSAKHEAAILEWDPIDCSAHLHHKDGLFHEVSYSTIGPASDHSGAIPRDLVTWGLCEPRITLNCIHSIEFVRVHVPIHLQDREPTESYQLRSEVASNCAVAAGCFDVIIVPPTSYCCLHTAQSGRRGVSKMSTTPNVMLAL